MHTLIIMNPVARRRPLAAELAVGARRLLDRGWRVDFATTTGPGDAEAMAREAAAAGLDIVVAAGGDGTLHDVANGLAGSATALGVVPFGTANVWAREAGVPFDPARALALLPKARRVRIDLGVAMTQQRTQRFMLMCGLGVDAEVVRRVGAGSVGKRSLGRVYYGALGVAAALRQAAVPARIEVTGLDGHPQAFDRSLLLGVAGNTQSYGGVVRLTAGARVDDGFLDMVLFSQTSVLGRVGYAARALRGGLHERPARGIDYLHARRIEIQPSSPLPVQLDGEYAGDTGGGPLILGVHHEAITVLLAPRPNRLLGERGGR